MCVCCMRSSGEYSPQSSLTPPNGIKPSREQYERIAKYTQVSLPLYRYRTVPNTEDSAITVPVFSVNDVMQASLREEEIGLVWIQ